MLHVLLVHMIVHWRMRVLPSHRHRAAATNATRNARCSTVCKTTTTTAAAAAARTEPGRRVLPHVHTVLRRSGQLPNVVDSVVVVVVHHRSMGAHGQRLPGARRVAAQRPSLGGGGGEQLTLGQESSLRTAVLHRLHAEQRRQLWLMHQQSHGGCGRRICLAVVVQHGGGVRLVLLLLQLVQLLHLLVDEMLLMDGGRIGAARNGHLLLLWLLQVVMLVVVLLLLLLLYGKIVERGGGVVAGLIGGRIDADEVGTTRRRRRARIGSVCVCVDVRCT